MADPQRMRDEAEARPGGPLPEADPSRPAAADPSMPGNTVVERRKSSALMGAAVIGIVLVLLVIAYLAA